MNNIKILQDKISSLELQCLNHQNPEVRYKWGSITDVHASHGRILWSDVNDETVLLAAIADAEQLLKQTN